MPISRQGWAYEIVKGGDRDALRFALYEVRFWTSAARQRDGLGSHVIDGRRCDLMNNFRMQIRTNHQRIVTRIGDLQEPEGYLLHSDGLLWVPQRVVVDEKLLAEFLTLNGKPTSGYTPWMFENYAGVDEPLSGMWQHERVMFDLLALAEANIERYIDVATQEQWEGDRRGTTLNLQVGSSGNDGRARATVGTDVRNSTSFFDNLAAFISIGTESSGPGQIRASYERIVSVAVPAGATIDAASIILTGQFGESSSVEWVIEAIDADDPSAPTSAIEWNAQTFTMASVTWDFSDIWTDGVEFTSPDIKTVIQEVVDRGGWATGQAMIVCPLDDVNTVTDLRRSPYSYDGDTAKAPKLDITFTALPPPPPPGGPPGSGIGIATAAALKAQGAHTGLGEPHYVAQIILDLVTGGIDNEPPPQSFELTLARILAEVNNLALPQIGYSSDRLMNELHDFMLITRERRKPITGQLIDIMEAL